MNFFVSIILILLSVIEIKSLCSLKQECGDLKNDTCRPRGRLENETSTHPMTSVKSLLDLCPQFKPGEQVCCTETQLAVLQNNLRTIDQIFGDRGQGCDICAANLKKFWCHFTCDPNQKSFLRVTGASNHTVAKNQTKYLTDIDLDVEENTMCDLFKSCKKTKFASQVPAMGNALGFLNFQGVNAYQKIAVFINLFQTKNKGLTFKAEPCDKVPDAEGKVGGYVIKKNCTCNSCSQKCSFGAVSTTPIFEGLSGLTVGLTYGIGFIITVLLVTYNIKVKGGIDKMEDVEDIKEEEEKDEYESKNEETQNEETKNEESKKEEKKEEIQDAPIEY